MIEEEIISSFSNDAINRIVKTFEKSLRSFDTIAVDSVSHNINITTVQDSHDKFKEVGQTITIILRKGI